MNHGSIVSVRALLAAALVMLAALLMPRTAAAQPGTVFDVKAVSAGEGQYGEFPLNFSVEYDNGIQQNIVIGHLNHLPVTHVYPALVDIIRSRNLRTVTLNDVFLQPEIPHVTSA